MALYSRPLKLSAIWKGNLVDSLINTSFELKVHSVFSKAVNIDSGNRLLSLGLRSVGRAASYISVYGQVDFRALGIQQGSRVEVTEDSMLLDGMVTIDLSNINKWEDRVDKAFLWDKKYISSENLRALKSSLDRYGAQKSLWKSNPERINKLLSPSPEEAVKCLLGYGIGLTPGGDDALIGFISAVSSNNIKGVFSEGLKQQVLGNLNSTSDISAEFLRLACSFHYHEYIQDMLISIRSGTPDNIECCARKLIGIGSTSGTDITGGIYLGFYGTA